MTQWLIQGGRVYTQGRFRPLEVLVEGERIVDTGRRLRPGRGRSVDARGCLVIPGAIDGHVHFALPVSDRLCTADDFLSGGAAAAAGGITTVIDYTTPRTGQSPVGALQERLRLAEASAAVDFSLHGVLLDWRPQWLEDLRTMRRAGVVSLKVFMIYAERGWQMADGKLLNLMDVCRRLKLLLCVHAENGAIIAHLTEQEKASPQGAWSLARSRPPLAELEAVSRLACLAGTAGCRVHVVHVSTARAAQLIGQAAAGGVAISGETCPQYLVLNESRLRRRDGHRFGCCPPLRPKADAAGLWQALAEGWLEALTTDHCAFSRQQKDHWGGDFTRIPYGLPGVETSLSLTFTFGVLAGKLETERWAFLHSEGPARLFGLYPQKGVIRPGADADLTIWDPAARWRVETRKMQLDLGWNPYQGISLRGRARQVFLRGQLIAENGRYVGSAPRGRFIKRR